VIPVEFDLAGFSRRDELHLTGGDPPAAYFSPEALLVWEGPAGWLGSAPPGGLVAFRIEAEGRVTVEHLAEEPALDAGLVARVRAIYDQVVAEPWLPVAAEELLLGLLAADRRLFARPRPPLAELCAAAGLERRGNEVAHEESVWLEAAKWARTQRVYEFLAENSARRAAIRVLDLADSAEPG